MISTHILDTNIGQPASGIDVSLEIKIGSQWEILEQAKTNADGRIGFTGASEPGQYRLRFNVAEYFHALGQATFYSEIPVEFHLIDTSRKYHVPLLLTAFGYSTYRGS